LPKNNEPGFIEKDNAGGGNISVNLNDSGDNKHSEMIETVKSLRAELQSVKTDNERILKA
jgi:phosphatidate phosphatase PAH1